MQRLQINTIRWSSYKVPLTCELDDQVHDFGLVSGHLQCFDDGHDGSGVLEDWKYLCQDGLQNRDIVGTDWDTYQEVINGKHVDPRI